MMRMLTIALGLIPLWTWADWVEQDDWAGLFEAEGVAGKRNGIARAVLRSIDALPAS